LGRGKGGKPNQERGKQREISIKALQYLLFVAAQELLPSESVIYSQIVGGA